MPATLELYPILASSVEVTLRQSFTLLYYNFVCLPFAYHSSAAPPTRPSQSSRQRSHSQDSVTQAAAAVERAKNKTGRPKKGSQHADVIDRLDFTGVGPSTYMCSPSIFPHLL